MDRKHKGISLVGANMKVKGKVPFETALDQTGFGSYSYALTALAGVSVIAYAFILHSVPMLVPLSACELQTNTAQRGALAVTPTIGANFGALVWGYFGDTRGRKPMLIASLLLSALANALASLSVNWIMFMVMLFVSSILSSGIFPLAMAIVSESVPLMKRNVTVLIVTSIFLPSLGFMAALAIPIIPLRFSYYLPAMDIYWNSWRTLMLIYSAPCLLTALCVHFFMLESPKFAFVRGQEKRALQILGTIYKKNNRKSKQDYEVKSLLADPQQTKKNVVKDQLVPLFKAPYLKYTIIMTILHIFETTGSFLVWLPTVAIQFIHALVETGEGYDLTLCQMNSIVIPTDPDAVPCNVNTTGMLLVLAVGVLQSVVNALLSLTVNRVGRRNTVMVVTALVGVSGVLVNVVPNAIASATLYVLFLLGYLVVGLYAAMGVALYPTHLRAMSMSVNMTGGRIGTIAFVQIINYLLANNCQLAFYIFGAINASSAIVASFLPDDRLIQKSPPPKKEEVKESISQQTLVARL